MTFATPPGPEPSRSPGDRPMIGEVAEFDEGRGLGIVDYGDGGQVPFHCTAISDGSRRIAVGTVVAFVVGAGRLGRLEARSVRPLPGVVPPGSTLADEQAAQPGTGSPPPPFSAPPSPGGDPSPDSPVADPSSAPPAGDPRPVPEAVEPGEPTPPAGSERAPDVPAAPPPPSPEPPGGPVEWDGPRPDFWSPFDRAPAGPPPTWRTPATPGPRVSDED